MTRYTAKQGRKSDVVVEVRPSQGSVLRWDLSEVVAVEVVADLHRMAAAAREIVGAQYVQVVIPAGGLGRFMDEITADEAIALADSITDVLEARDAG